MESWFLVNVTEATNILFHNQVTLPSYVQSHVILYMDINCICLQIWSPDFGYSVVGVVVHAFNYCLVDRTKMRTPKLSCLQFVYYMKYDSAISGLCWVPFVYHTALSLQKVYDTFYESIFVAIVTRTVGLSHCLFGLLIAWLHCLNKDRKHIYVQYILTYCRTL